VLKIINEPLVSIIVITYNSAKYVLETLESAKIQTYENTELIIADDCSKDNTVSICQHWLDKNKNKFIRTKLIAAKENAGIPANCNRGLYEAKGFWLKLIAGDDILLSNCIRDCVDFCSGREIKFLFSRYQTFSNNGVSIAGGEKYLEASIPYYQLSWKEQYLHLIKYSCFPNAVTAFIQTNELLKLNGFDERIPFLEDYPMWLKATKAGNKLYFMGKNTVLYRKDGNNLTSSRQLKRFLVQQKKVFFLYRSSELIKINFFIWFDLFLKYLIIDKSIIGSRLLRLLSPYTIYKVIFRVKKVGI
jgi:glycosyltransferase involved in cell wall biosynthesis